MVTRNVWLMGGPPWRLRFAPFPNRRIRITQRIAKMIESKFVSGRDSQVWFCLHKPNLSSDLPREVQYFIIFPNGRANQEGMRDGDMVETISRQHCTSYKMLNAKVSES